MTEGPSNPIPRKQLHPGRQFLILISLFAAVWIGGNIIGIVVVQAKYGQSTLDEISKMNLSGPHASAALWVLQFFSTTLPILITPIVFSYRFVRDPNDYIKNHFHFPWTLMAIVFLTMTVANPMIEYLSNINGKIDLPRWMTDDEQSIKKMSDLMMAMPNFSSMLYNLLFIGLLTAVVEEILFRGCFQTVLFNWTKNIHAAIWITAILFSAFHMEFSGFLPRLLLGLLFGYFTAWSGSIWPAIWGHFVNNGTIVVLTYLAQNKMINLNVDEPQMFNNAGYIISFVITLLLLLYYRYISVKWQTVHHGEELD